MHTLHHCYVFKLKKGLNGFNSCYWSSFLPENSVGGEFFAPGDTASLEIITAAFFFFEEEIFQCSEEDK